METGLRSAHFETQCLDGTERRARSPQKRMSLNTVIVILGALVLFTVLVFLERRIRRLETFSSSAGNLQISAAGKLSDGLML